MSKMVSAELPASAVAKIRAARAQEWVKTATDTPSAGTGIATTSEICGTGPATTHESKPSTKPPNDNR